MSKMKSYRTGFRLIDKLPPGGLKTSPIDAVNITIGECLFDNGSGYLTNTVTSFAATFRGVAHASVDNSAGSAGDKTIQYIPPLPNLRFEVPAGGSTVLAQTDENEICDLSTNASIDPTSNSPTAWGFRIDDIDISTDALAVDAQGFAIGRFVTQ